MAVVCVLDEMQEEARKVQHAIAQERALVSSSLDYEAARAEKFAQRLSHSSSQWLGTFRDCLLHGTVFMLMLVNPQRVRGNRSVVSTN